MKRIMLQSLMGRTSVFYASEKRPHRSAWSSRWQNRWWASRDLVRNHLAGDLTLSCAYMSCPL